MFLFPDTGFSAPDLGASQKMKRDAYHEEFNLIAQGKKKARKKRLTGSGKVRTSGSKTQMDFDAVDIVGSRRTPLGSVVNQVRSKKNYEFVRVRLQWHPEMINSAGSLDTKIPATQ